MTMESTFACGRCAHRFQRQTGDPQSVACPKCDFNFCYKVGRCRRPQVIRHRKLPVNMSTCVGPLPSRNHRRREQTQSSAPAPTTTIADTDTGSSFRGLYGLAVLAVISAVFVSAWVFWPGANPDEQANPGPRPATLSENTAPFEPASQVELSGNSTEGQSIGVPDPTAEDSDQNNVANVTVARSLDEAGDAIVKIVIPLGIGNLASRNRLLHQRSRLGDHQQSRACRDHHRFASQAR